MVPLVVMLNASEERLLYSGLTWNSAVCKVRAGLPADSQLVIMGKGRLEQSLKALATELGIEGQVLPRLWRPVPE